MVDFSKVKAIDFHTHAEEPCCDTRDDGYNEFQAGMAAYFKNPAGGLAEYYWDEDAPTENWKPRTWDPAPDTFAEWVLDSGLPRSKALPPTREKRDAK